MTNFEMLKATIAKMTPEEMAVELSAYICGRKMFDGCEESGQCRACCLEWLEMEAKENEGIH